MNITKQIPDFCVIGGARCATTSLYQALRHHPQISLTSVKETHFLAKAEIMISLNGPGDRDQYRSLETLDDEGYRLLFNEEHSSGDSDLTRFGEVCPSYLSNSSSAKEISRRNPNCKILVILRNPVERLISNYRLLVEYGREDKRIDEAIQLEKQRIAMGWEWSWRYFENSLYGKYLLEYLKYFNPGNIILIDYEKLTASKFISPDLLRFIGVEERADIPLRQYNRTRSSLPFLRMHRWSQMHSPIYREIFAKLKQPLSKVFDYITPSYSPTSKRPKEDSRFLYDSPLWPQLSDMLREDALILRQSFGVDFQWTIS